MKILHCISWLAMGGAEKQLYYVACEQARLGHEVHIVYTNGDNAPSGYKECGVSIWRLSSSHNHDPVLILKMLRLLKYLQPNILQTWIIQMDVIAGIAAAMTGIPWVLREPSSADAWPISIKNALRTMVARTAKAVIANSSAGAQYWSRILSKNKCHVVPNALPLLKIDQTLPKKEFMSGRRLVLYAGRLNQKEKNILGTLTALIKLVQERDVIVAVLGDGPEYAQAREAVRFSGQNDKIIFHGQVDDVWAWMKSASVFVNASYVEGQPNAVLEAMACVVPVVLSDIPAHRELASNGAAWFVDPDSPSSIKDRICTVLDSPEEAYFRAQRARSIVDHFSVSRAALGYLSIYSSVVK